MVLSENLQKMIDADKIELPKYTQLNSINNRTKLSSLRKKAVRGELNAYAQTNTGAARYGLGRYSTTSKAYAKQFGTVRPIEDDEFPTHPLMLKTMLDVELLEQFLIQEHDLDRKEFYSQITLDQIIPKMGYDGLTIGYTPDCIIVKYPTEEKL